MRLKLPNPFISSYVVVNMAMIMLSTRILTNIRKRISKNDDTPFFQSFQQTIYTACLYADKTKHKCYI